MGNKKKYKGCLLLIIFLLSASCLQAQESNIRGRWNVRIGMGSYDNVGDFKSSFTGEVNYGIVDNIEVGASIGISWLDLASSKGNTNSYTVYTRDTALRFKCHLSSHAVIC